MKTVVVTGGSEGLGRTIATQLSKSHNVYILARTKSKVQVTAKEIGCKYKVCDVADYQQVESIFAEIVAESGQIDVLINNAGLWIQDSLEENAPEAISDVMNVNALGVIYCTKAAVPHMKQIGAGTIIQINSQAGLHGKAERSVYNASKWAVTGFTKSIQAELEPHNIKVVGLYPAMLHTEMFSKQDIEKDMNKALDTQEVAKTIEFMLSLEDSTLLLDIGIKKMGY